MTDSLIAGRRSEKVHVSLFHNALPKNMHVPLIQDALPKNMHVPSSPDPFSRRAKGGKRQILDNPLPPGEGRRRMQPGSVPDMAGGVRERAHVSTSPLAQPWVWERC